MDEYRYKWKNSGLLPYEWLLTEKNGLLLWGFSKRVTFLRWNKYDDWDITYMYIFYFILRQSESVCLNNYNMALHTGVPSE